MKTRPMTRLEANVVLLEVIRNYVEANPDQRFGQILTNLDIATHNREVLYDEGPHKGQWHMKDIFFEEPVETLKRALNEYEEQVENESIDELPTVDTQD